MDQQHSVFHEDIPAYALGALDADETAALEAHLLTCESCRQELADYRGVSDNLLAALPPRQPPAALRDRLRDRLRAALPSAQQKAAPRRPAWSFGRLALGAGLVLLLALNLFSFLQLRDLQRQQAQLLQQVQQDQAALAMLSYPGTQSFPIEAGQVSGTLLLDRDRNAGMLIVWDLPPLPADQTYQAWLVQPDGIRVSAAIFRPQNTDAYTVGMISAPQSLDTFSSLGVTVEPAGGSSGPTGERVLKVDF